MNAAASRRAGGSLRAFLTAPSCRATHRRRIASSPPTRQQNPPSTTSTTSTAPSSTSTTNNTNPPTARKPPQTPSDPIPPPPLRSLTAGLSDPPPSPSPTPSESSEPDWTRSFHGLSSTPFTAEQATTLQQPLSKTDIEIKPDGIIYLPEIKYRRILNKAFGPGGWGLAPRGETIVTGKVVTREYGLVCHGRLVSIARGEQAYFDPDGIPTATEGCKSNALMRCCKDLGVASELWDPRFIRGFMAEVGRETVVEHVVSRKRRRHWMRKDDEVRWPFKEVAGGAGGAGPGGR
ncbi:Mitochondrial genome maintenance protein [Salinomyces thailandicus]|uniref:Mitochondrial genome maintenance protein MGM101 n=1 Tax=Salinomyces thailandicus TaxID=706561 RepID=A0A4U0TVA0_9PEZI|nr:Mitochondrial genome maintenance protein [Salinomyces thailandica]